MNSEQSVPGPPIIAITGATGFVGRYLVESLAGNSWLVKPFSRSGACGGTALELTGRPDWGEHLLGVHTVIHCAAFAQDAPGPGVSQSEFRETIFRVNRDAVAALAAGCARSGVSRLIFLSSAKVYGEQSLVPFREDDPRLPADDYGRSKMEAEEILNSFRGPGFEVCSLRLPMVYGPTPKANLERLRRLAASGAPLPFGSIKNKRSMLSLSNLAAVVRTLLEKESWPFSELNVADPEPLSTPELIRSLSRSAGKSARLFPCPPGILRTLLTVARRRADFERLAGSLELSTDRLHKWLPALSLESTTTSLARTLAPSVGQSH